MDNFTIYNESCLTAIDKLSDDSIDLILTDPPYNLAKFMRNRDTNLKALRPNFFGDAGWDDLDCDEWLSLMSALFQKLSRIIKYAGSIVMFTPVQKIESIIKIAEQNKFYYKTTGIWHKNNPMPINMNLHFINAIEPWLYFTYKKHTGTFNNNNKALHNLIESPVASISERKFGTHPTQKPISLLKPLVQILSNEGDTILDPFMGSGSSGAAALSLNRKFIGVDINSGYCNIAKSRFEDLQQPTLFND